MSLGVRVARWLGLGALLIGYPVLAHYTLLHVQNGTLGALVAVAPVGGVGLVYAWKASPRWVGLSVFVLASAAATASWTLLEHYFGVLYWLQDAGMQCLLFMTFARTLVGGRKPLCTQLAEMAHGSITPQHARYADQITWVWAGFFALMATVSTLLFFLAPLTVWSVFANFLTLPLVALMFLVEFGARRILLPERVKVDLSELAKNWKKRRSAMASVSQAGCKP